MFYSATAGGFFSAAIHGKDIPADAVKVTQAQYHALLEGQASGRQIRPGAGGRPFLTAEVDLTDTTEA